MQKPKTFRPWVPGQTSQCSLLLHALHGEEPQGRRGLWAIKNSLDKEFCLEALEMALEGGRKPETFHSDQGCQFTSSDFVARLQAEKIKISWSRRKRCYDNILVERLWRTVKYE